MWFVFELLSPITWTLLALAVGLLLLWVEPLLVLRTRSFLSILLVTRSCFCRWGTWPYDCFKRIGVDGPRPLPFVGTLLHFRKVRQTFKIVSQSCVPGKHRPFEFPIKCTQLILLTLSAFRMFFALCLPREWCPLTENVKPSTEMCGGELWRHFIPRRIIYSFVLFVYN